MAQILAVAPDQIKLYCRIAITFYTEHIEIIMNFEPLDLLVQ